MFGSHLLRRIDWLTVLFYALLVTMGWINIYSSTFDQDQSDLFDLSQLYGKQLIFIGISVVVIFLSMALEASFYERFASLFYLGSLLLLLGLFLFGKNISGATSWYSLGFFNLQPSELAKVTTALAIAKYLSDIQTDISSGKDQLTGLFIILLPALLIIPQPDPGSALVFFSLIFVLFREGMPIKYLLLVLLGVILFITTLMYGTVWVGIGMGLIIALIFLLKKSSQQIAFLPLLVLYLGGLLFSYSVRFVYDNVFEQRHRDRFGLWLRLEKDPDKLEEIRRSIGYNTFQSEKAIESGGLWGKGFLEGTRTKGDFVPEQHSDYIFSTVGEEWGFIGTSGVILLFTMLLLRLVHLAERQRNPFSRMYGYGVVSILLIHYFINIGMVIGILPTIGIPLPLFSYGGSSLIGFSLLIFIFLRLDANRLNEWT
jgi:rod shape determining protein RodA